MVARGYLTHFPQRALRPFTLVNVWDYVPAPRCRFLGATKYPLNRPNRWGPILSYTPTFGETAWFGNQAFPAVWGLPASAPLLKRRGLKREIGNLLPNNQPQRRT